MYYTYKYDYEISVDELLENYIDEKQFEHSCSQCPNYGKIYSCPPFNFDKTQFLKGFSKVKLIGLKILFDGKLIGRSYSALELKNVENTVLAPERNAFNADLLVAENEKQVALYACSCELCGMSGCNRAVGKPCARPDKLRYNLEALGADVVGLARDFLGVDIIWAKENRLPEYYFFVGALLIK